MSASIEALLTSIVRNRRTKDLDVVIVHLEGKRQSRETWRTRWSKKDQGPDWIKEWLPQDTEKLGARLIEFRCNIEERHCSNLSYYVEAQSNSLLSLLRKRRKRTGKERPIVFIAQSIGGLVVTSALTRAAQVDPISPNSRAIFSSTKMVIFFATAHPIVDTGKSEWKDRFIDSLSRFGNISKHLLRNRVDAEEYETLRLQADCYKSIEGRFRNVMIRESLPNTKRMPRKQQVWAKMPDTISGHPNWSIFFGTVDFDTHPARQQGESYKHMLSWVEKSPQTHIETRQRLCLNERSEHLSSSGKQDSRLPASSGKFYGEDDYKRLIVQCENQSHVARGTLVQLNNLARIYAEDDRLDEARWLHERIRVTILIFWELPLATIDAPTLKDLLPMLRDAADLAGRQGRYSQGVSYLESSLRLTHMASAKTTPDICRVHAELGVLYSYDGQLSKARKSYDQALQRAEDCNMNDDFKEMVRLNRRSSDKLLRRSRILNLRFAIISICYLVSASLFILWLGTSEKTIDVHYVNVKSSLVGLDWIRGEYG